MRTIFAHRACGILYRFISRYTGCYLLPANVCPVVPLTFRLANVAFEFVDINERTLCVDEDVCLSLLKKEKCNGLVFVHTYGTDYNPQCFFDQIKNIDQNFRIVDDKCLCSPDLMAPQTISDLTLYSTGYAKYVDLGKGAFGYLQDGLGLSCEQVLYDGVDIEPYYKSAFLKNEKMDRIVEGWLDTTISIVPDEKYISDICEKKAEICKRKARINKIYTEVLRDVETLGDEFNQWRYNILVNDKEKILKLIFDNGMFASSHYQPSSRLFVEEKYPNAEKLYNHVINLFNDNYMDSESARKLAISIQNFESKVKQR